MSYLTQAKLADDGHIRLRVTACAATEQIEHPDAWAYEHRWQLSAQPGWVAAYASAAVAGDDPGANEAAITDGMILSAVQHLVDKQEGEGDA